LSFLQAQLNNSLNTTTRLLSTKIIYNFKIKKVLLLLHDRLVKLIINNLSNCCLKYHVEASEVIAFANTKINIYYNARHVSLIIRSNKKAYLKLNHKYQLLSKLNRKLFLQQCDSFLIKRRIEQLAYELELSFN